MFPSCARQLRLSACGCHSPCIYFEFKTRFTLPPLHENRSGTSWTTTNDIHSSSARRAVPCAKPKRERETPPPQHETKRIEVECRDEITLGADSTGNSISFLQEHGFAFEIPCLLPRVREHLLLLLFHLCLVLVFCCVHCLRVLVVPCTILVNAFFILPCLSLVWKRHFKMKTPHTRAHAHENENAEEEKRTNQLLLLSICLRREGGGGIEKAKSQPETQDENQEGEKKKTN